MSFRISFSDQPDSVTLADVARLAGVSSATASRALHGSSGRHVRAELKDRVTAAAEELGYSVNAQAQAVARGTSNTVALLVGEISDPYYAAVSTGVIRAADRENLTVSLHAVGTDAERQVRAVRGLLGQRPRAVIRAVGTFTDAADEARVQTELVRLARAGAGISVVTAEPQESVDELVTAGAGGTTAAGRATGLGSGFGSRLSDGFGSTYRAMEPLDNVISFGSVVVENRESACALAFALIGQGYREFAVLSGDEACAVTNERVEGFVDALSDKGIEVREGRIIASPATRDGGFHATARLLEQDARPDCIFAVTDVMAGGAVAALRAHGLEPGSDVAIAGFDDLAIVRDSMPPLTTVALPLEEMGEAALGAALATARNRRGAAADDRHEAAPVVRGQVIVRSSTPKR